MEFLRYIVLAYCVLVHAPIMGQEADMQYERSSLHVMLLSHHNQAYEENIKEVFDAVPFPERFDNHDLGAKSVALAKSEEDQSRNLLDFCRQVNLGQKMLAKWFNRDKTTGCMNMDLIKTRGLYNATQTQANIARSSMRGLALLQDAGENLMKQSYLVVNDIQYREITRGMNVLKVSSYGELKGFKVEVTSYLFRLKWDDDLASEFYAQYYTERGDKDKVDAFKRDGRKWQMEYVGKTTCSSDRISKKASLLPKRYLEMVATRALDKNLAQLQHEHPDFRIKAPLVATEPLKAYVGKKEDITPLSHFEVLERRIDNEGRLSYKRIGVIKPKSNHIWDNRYMADDEDADARLGYTEFEKVSGGEFLPGMLIREIESK